MLRSLLITVAAGLTCLGASAAGPVVQPVSASADLRITEIDQDYFGKADAVAPFVKSNRKKGYTKDPQFTIHHPETDEVSSGWFAADPQGLYIRIVVNDDNQINEYADQDLYKGDAVQIGLDGRGDGSQGNDPSLGGAFGDDDIAFTLASGSKGPQGWIHFKGDRQVNEPVPESDITIERDESNAQTTYELFVEWKQIRVTPGLYPGFGIAVMINDSDPGLQRQVRYSYGEGAGGRMTPGMFKRIMLEGNPLQVIAAETINDVYWDAAHPVRCLIALQDAGMSKLTAGFGDEDEVLEIDSGKGIRRFMVELHPGIEAGDNLLSVQLEAGKATGGIRKEIPIVLPDQVVNSFLGRLDELMRDSPHPLFTRHLASLRSVTMVEWGRVKLILDENTRHAEESLGFVESMLHGLNGPAGRWENYRDGKLSMILSFVSRRDRTVQYYTLTLPKEWDVEKEYPLFVELHGAGNQNPLSGPAARLGFDEGTSPLMGYSSVRGYAASCGVAYHIEPFGRGNTGYRDIGAIDVWEAFDDVNSLFKINPDRRYLFGFSMGGGGTAYLGMRTPHLWAAIAVYSGAYRESSPVPIGMNVSYLPIWMWCGEADFLYNNMRALEEEIMDYGNKPVTTWVPGLGHNYRGDGQEAGVKWLLEHTRKRPDTFSFVAVDDDYTGTWGLDMKRDITRSGVPKFACTIAGGVVEIDSEGTEELTVDMGEKGLQLTGDVVLIWNGEEVYRGVPCTFLLSASGNRELKRTSAARRGSLVRSILSKY